MTKQTRALQMAIEALIYHTEQTRPIENTNKAIQACKEALAETQEPVLYIDGGGLDGHATWAQAIRCQDTDIELYTTPPSRKWVGLSDEEINLIYPCTGGEHDFKDIARAVEARLKEKNNA